MHRRCCLIAMILLTAAGVLRAAEERPQTLGEAKAKDDAILSSIGDGLPSAK